MDPHTDRPPLAPPAIASALAEGAVVAELPDLGALRLSGADRVDFLHGQVSQDVRGLPAGGATRALLLNHKGHARAEMTVVRREDDLYVSVEDGRGELVRRELEAHVIFDQVAIEELGGTLAALTLQGAGAAEALRGALGLEPPSAGVAAEAPFAAAKVLVVSRDRSGRGGVDVHVLRADLGALRAALGAAGALPAAAGGLEPFRIAAGLPSAAGEAGEGVLPQEAGLEGLVSYRKGCYLGQEIMARIEARGSVRRELAGLRLAAPPADDAREVRLGERSVGRLGSVAVHPELGPVALAVLRKDVPEGAELRAAGSAARRVGLPMA